MSSSLAALALRRAIDGPSGRLAAKLGSAMPALGAVIALFERIRGWQPPLDRLLIYGGPFFALGQEFLREH